MFLILQIAASCGLITLHWSRYWRGKRHTVCTFRYKFILSGPRAGLPEQDVSTSCRCTHFVISVPCTTEINHSFYELRTFCSQAKMHFWNMQYSGGKTVRSNVVNNFFFRLTLVIALKINWLLFQTKGFINNLVVVYHKYFEVCHGFFKL